MILYADKGKIAHHLKLRIQDGPMSRWLSPLLAFCLSFMLITTFAPVIGLQIDRQLDFWLLWIGLVIFLALPLIYLEFALVKRAKTTVLNALMSLTRDADASVKWRLVGWFSVIFIPFLAGAMLANASYVAEQFVALPIAVSLVFVALAIVSLVLSFLDHKILVLLSVVAVAASIVLSFVMGRHIEAWQMTALIFPEWGKATILALVASGLGLGVYAQVNAESAYHDNKTTPVVLPIWFAQLASVVAFGFFAIQTPAPAISIVVAVVFGAALLLKLARQQLADRKLAVVAQYATIVLPVALWAVPLLQTTLNLVVLIWGLLSCLGYAIFAGWIMKISHLRKVMNFDSEWGYNIWRIAVRIVIPLSIIVAIASVFVGWF